MDIALLKPYQLLNQLSDAQLILLMGNSRVSSLHANTKLFVGRPDFAAKPDKDTIYYLLSGDIHIQKPDTFVPVKINAHDTVAKQLIDPLKHPQWTYRSASPVTLLHVSRTHLSELLKEAPSADYSVKPALRENTNDNRDMFLEVYTHLRNNTLLLPSLPNIAWEVRTAIQAGVDAQAIANIVTQDVAITAKLLKAANSPIYRARTPYTNCAQAIVRLGLTTTKQLVTSLALKEVFTSDHAALKKPMAQLWDHAVETAALSAVFARLTPHLNADKALLVGLLHNIGKIPLLNYAGKYPKLIGREDLLKQALDDYAPELGAVLLKRWNFGEDYIDAARNAENWTRDHQGSADYCDLVQVGRLHCTESFPESAPLDFSSVPAFNKVTQQQGEHTYAKIQDDTQNAIEATREMFAG